MIKSILLWLIDKIRRWADPDYAKRADEYTEQKRVVEATEHAALEEIAVKGKEATEISAEREQVTAEVSMQQAEVHQIDEKIKQVQDEKQKRIDDVARSDDRDILRRDL